MTEFKKQFVEYFTHYYWNTPYNLIQNRIVGNTVGAILGDQNLDWSGFMDFDYDIVDVFFEDTNNSALCFSLIVRCDIDFNITCENRIFFSSNQIAFDGAEWWFKIFLTSSLDIDLYDLNVYCIEDYSESAYLLEQDTGDIISYIAEGDLEKVAEDFLIKHCPIALVEPMALPIENIAGNMGLKIHYVEMSDNCFGQLFFAKNGNNPRGTLWLNQRHVEKRPKGTKNFTIAHECIHWDRHRKYMDLRRILDEDESASIECLTSPKVESQFQKTYRDMEWQANNLAARILMPEKTTRKKLEEFLSELKRLSPNMRNGLVMAATIQKLAKFYQVSWATAKYQAIQLGFEQAAGVFNYVDGQIVAPIWFKDGALSKYQTFVVDRPIAEKEMAENEKLNRLVKNGHVVYLNGMFIFNHPRYVGVNSKGELKPTEYALEHADECCFVMTVQKTWNQDDSEYSYMTYFLNRPANPDKDNTGSIILDDPHNSYLTQKMEEPEKIGKEINEMMELLEHGLSGVFPDETEEKQPWMIEGILPTTLHQKLQWHFSRMTTKKENDINDLMDVSTACSLDESTIEKHLTQKNDPLLPTVMAYCIGLHLEPYFALDLIDKAGFSILSPTLENAVYLYLIFYCRYESIQTCNWIIYEINKLDHTGGKRRVRYIPNEKKGKPKEEKDEK